MAEIPPQEAERPDTAALHDPIVPPAEPAAPTTSSPPAIRRSRSNRVIAGVCGGLGRYLGIDPVLVRIAFVALVFAGGSGVLIYILAWILIPEESDDATAAIAAVANAGDRGRLIAGGVLIVLGALLLIRIVLPWFDERVIWAAILIGLGAALIFRGTGR